MRAVVQRVSSCRVVVEGAATGEIGMGLLAYIGIASSDERDDADYIVNKISGLRIFKDDHKAMNLSLEDVGGDICVVSQFTLYGDTRKGRRPSFNLAAPPEIAIPLYEYCINAFISRGFMTASGRFGAHMNVDYVNDGPVTILVDSQKIF